jgi:hypothetical protein
MIRITIILNLEVTPSNVHNHSIQHVQQKPKRGNYIDHRVDSTTSYYYAYA